MTSNQNFDHKYEIYATELVGTKKIKRKYKVFGKGLKKTTKQITGPDWLLKKPRKKNEFFEKGRGKWKTRSS